MATVAQFQTRFPEFCQEDDDRVQMFLDDAALLMKHPAKWLSFYDVAQQYYAAHLLAVANFSESGDSGIMAPAKKQEVDDVVIENAIGNIDPTLEDLYSTSYGKRYVTYRRKITVGIYGV